MIVAVVNVLFDGYLLILLQDSQTEMSKAVQQQLHQMPEHEEERIVEGSCDDNVDDITYIQVRFKSRHPSLFPSRQFQVFTSSWLLF